MERNFSEGYAAALLGKTLPEMKVVAARRAKELMRRGMSQNQAADAVGLSRTKLSTMLNPPTKY